MRRAQLWPNKHFRSGRNPSPRFFEKALPVAPYSPQAINHPCSLIYILISRPSSLLTDKCGYCSLDLPTMLEVWLLMNGCSSSKKVTPQGSTRVIRGDYQMRNACSMSMRILTVGIGNRPLFLVRGKCTEGAGLACPVCCLLCFICSVSAPICNNLIYS